MNGNLVFDTQYRVKYVFRPVHPFRKARAFHIFLKNKFKKKGWARQKYLATMVKEMRKVSILVNDVKYDSIAEACRANNKEKSLIYARLHKGMSVEKAFSKDKVSTAERKITNALLEAGCRKIADNRALKTIWKRTGKLDDYTGIIAKELFQKRPDGWFERPDGQILLVEVDDRGHFDPDYYYYNIPGTVSSFANKHERDVRMDKLAAILGVKAIRIPTCHTLDKALIKMNIEFAMTTSLTDRRINCFHETADDYYFNN